MNRLLVRVAAFFILALLIHSTTIARQAYGIDDTSRHFFASFSYAYQPAKPTQKTATRKADSTKVASVGKSVAVQQTIIAKAVPPTAGPNPLVSDGVTNDLLALGLDKKTLQDQGIGVQASLGPIVRRCASGSSGKKYVEGMALRTGASYTPCPNGESPVYDAYYIPGTQCSVIYNQKHSKKIAILAHEVAHCLHIMNGEFRAFDINYRKIRPQVNELDHVGTLEIVADDIAHCHFKESTDWSVGYYDHYAVSPPTTSQCRQINEITEIYLLGT